MKIKNPAIAKRVSHPHTYQKNHLLPGVGRWIVNDGTRENGQRLPLFGPGNKEIMQLKHLINYGSIVVFIKEGI
ncbi:MAG: hypothetical protein NT040_08725 [Bacteroidetes bacterium]|nr:hypothetical protein [Bacteroidota bacterium]